MNQKTLLEQFDTFCVDNEVSSYEQAVEYFAVFGGLNRRIDVHSPIEEQIEKYIFKKFKFLRNDISALTTGDFDNHLILTGLALGDRRTNSAFKRAKINFDDGIDIVDKLCERGMLKLEKTAQKYTKNKFDNSISEKLLFTTPFARFWFAFVSPIFKGVRDGDYKEAFTRFENYKVEQTALVYEQLSFEVLIKACEQEDPIKEIARYWDNTTEAIDIIATTKSGKIIVGLCKYTNNKVKTSDLNKVKQICEKLGIKVDTYAVFAKKGFTSELKGQKGKDLLLFTPKHLASLISK